MMTAATLPSGDLPETTEPVIRHLRDGDEVLRCAAARALAATGGQEAAAALVEALLDEDPDVRTDAMGALILCARPEDVDAIRRSLLGDPVKEVKIAAINTLARLEDRTSVPLLASLVKDRCDHDVAWEDEAGMWDDWLDVQLAAIEALGRMKVPEVVEDLLAAREDEMGQELDDVVFAALAGIPGAGITALLALLHDGAARVREQALVALTKAQPQALAPVLEAMLEDASPDVRCLAVQSLDGDDPALERLLREDASPAVRRAALQKLGVGRRDLALAALNDVDEDLRALALDLVLSDPAAALPEDLAANVQAWLPTAGPTLATAAVRHLPRLSGAPSFELLTSVIEEETRPLEVRLAAVAALPELRFEASIALLERGVRNPIRQIRAAALVALTELAKAESRELATPARALLAAAVRGGFSEGAQRAQVPMEEEAHSPAASKEEAGDSRITITREGEILRGDQAEEESNVVDLRFPTSTLAALQEPPGRDAVEVGKHRLESPRAGDSPNVDHSGPMKRGQGKYRRRVAVDGPDDYALDLRLLALRIAADCPGEEVEAALVEAAVSAETLVKSSAFAALARRAKSQPGSPTLLPVLLGGLGDENALIRGHALQAVANRDDIEAGRLLPLLGDDDAVVRAEALNTLGDSGEERVFAALEDDSALVRRAALALITSRDSTADLERALKSCLDRGWADSLTELCMKSAEARNLLLRELHDPALGRWQTLTILDAVGSNA